MKNFIASFLILCSIQAFSQTKLTVTAVDASETSIYNSAAPKHLGKPFLITVYDNSVSIKVGNQSSQVLKKTSENIYVQEADRSSNETQTLTLKIVRTFSVITEAQLNIQIKEKYGRQRSAWIDITAKRF